MLCTKDVRLTYSLCHNKLILSALTGPGCLPQGNWLPDSPDGCRVRQLLHTGSHVDPHPRVPESRRGDEEDCAQGVIFIIILAELCVIEQGKEAAIGHFH